MPSDWHLHVYFEPDELPLAQLIRTTLRERVPALTYLGHPVPRPVGPHTRPMLEAHVGHADLDEAIAALERVRQHLSVLIHPVQDNEVAAHTSDARWLGTPLPLNLENL